jgi:hypothetical protein
LEFVAVVGLFSKLRLDNALSKYLAKMDVRFEYAVHANALQIVVYFVPTFLVDSS